MMSNFKTLDWQIYPDAMTVAQQACQRISIAAQQAIKERDAFHLVLAGGRTPEQTYHLLSKMNTTWSKWFIYYGDERCYGIKHPERNSTMAINAWLSKVDIPAAQHYPISAELGAELAAEYYKETIANIHFDMVLLGMGEDGHTASLFPNLTYHEEETVHAVLNAPKPPPERVSLSAKTLSQTRQILFLVTGEGKQTAVQQWSQGQDLPIARLHAKTMCVLSDEAASKGL
jgi:6-phosphogluconolactonase